MAGGAVFDAFGVTLLGDAFELFVGSWGPLCSHWLSLGDVRPLKGHICFVLGPHFSES